LVPPSSYSLAKAPDTAEFLAEKNRYPFLLTGALPVAHKFFAIKGTTLDLTVKAMMNGNALRGGHNQGVGLMVSACGFSGMQSDRVRRISTLAAMALPPLLAKEKVDIRVEAQDIPPLALTFAYYMPPVDGKRAFDVSYIVSSIHLGSLGEYEASARTSDRPDAILVFIDDEVCPSISTKKNVSEEWTARGKKKLERYAKSQRFIALCAILSDEYFKSYHVSFHAPPVEFVGFLTTEKNFGLVGVENDTLVAIAKNVVNTWQDFLERVVEANTRFNTFFLAPTTLYSPMANILRTPKGHMKLEIGDGGEWQWGRVVTPSFVSSSGDTSIPGEDITEAAQNISSSLSPAPLLSAPRSGQSQTSGYAPSIYAFNMGFPGSNSSANPSSASSAPSPSSQNPPQYLPYLSSAYNAHGGGGRPPSSTFSSPPPTFVAPPPPPPPPRPVTGPLVAPASVPFEGEEITGVGANM
jgi:hypothetical protein